MTWRGPHAALTEDDRDALAPYLGGNLGVQAIADDLGWPKERVYRVADKYGLPIRARARPKLRNIAAVIGDMRPLQAVEYLTEAYLNLSGESPAREAQLVADYRMTPGDAKLYAVLEARAGEFVGYGMLETVLVQAGYDGVNIRNRISVSMWRIRQRLAQAGLPVVIEAVQREGYRLRRREMVA